MSGGLHANGSTWALNQGWTAWLRNASLAHSFHTVNMGVSDSTVSWWNSAMATFNSTDFANVNPELTHTQSMNPTVSVADDGTVAVQYYNDRNNVYSDGSTYDVDIYVTFFDKNLVRLGEQRVTTDSFDL